MVIVLTPGGERGKVNSGERENLGMSDAPPAIRVLIVDDDREIREMLGDLLRDEGFAVEAAWNGQTALSRLNEGFHPDVIVLDIMMPVMDGLTFRGLQRSHPGLADIPVIGLTAFPSPDADFECLTKPLRFEVLVEKLRSAVAAR
jgi:CheY-like chemotaxis protein